ncbi:DUF1474 family protein [Staphylococcus saprophyticus]|nr:DUF1474 family protein [Staphylococcus saprophyticus]
MNMKWELNDLICEFDVLRNKIEDVLTAHSWFMEDTYLDGPFTNIEEITRYGLAHNEHRIMNSNYSELMYLYLKQYDELLNRFKALDIKTDRTHDEIGNGQHNVEQ